MDWARYDERHKGDVERYERSLWALYKIYQYKSKMYVAVLVLYCLRGCLWYSMYCLISKQFIYVYFMYVNADLDKDCYLYAAKGNEQTRWQTSQGHVLTRKMWITCPCVLSIWIKTTFFIFFFKTHSTIVS